LVSNVLLGGAVVTSEGKQTLSITSDQGTKFQGDKFDKSEEELSPNESQVIVLGAEGRYLMDKNKCPSLALPSKTVIQEGESLGI
jgi:hypothetical protein